MYYDFDAHDGYWDVNLIEEGWLLWIIPWSRCVYVGGSKFSSRVKLAAAAFLKSGHIPAGRLD